MEASRLGWSSFFGGSRELELIILVSNSNFDTDPDMERGLLSFSYTGGSACPKSSARRATVIQLYVSAPGSLASSR